MPSHLAPCARRSKAPALAAFLLLAIGLSCLLQSPLSGATPPQSLKIRMRDGVQLGADLYLPEGQGPWPTVLLRFPYNKALAAGIGPEAAQRGYAFVAQDTRGRYASDGENLPFDADGFADGKWDGVDTIDWIVRQPWSNKRVGSWGGSAGAITQYLLAGAGHSNLLSQHLTVGTPSLYIDGIYRGGIFRKSMIEDWIKATKFASNALDLWLTNSTYSAYWKNRESIHRYTNIHAAGLHIGGWFDIFAQSTVDAFLGYQNSGAASAQGRQKLIMGPWAHAVFKTQAGDLEFPGAKSPPGGLHDTWKWFAATLKSLKSDVDAFQALPAVTYYVMGASGESNAPGNLWRTAPQWPPKSTPKKLYLNPDRSASFRPAAQPGELAYKSDPTKPVPTLGGYELTLPAGPKDQRAIESREDLLVFTSAPLDAPVEITGNITAQIHLKCDAPDADLIVRFCDVYPDGRSMALCDGVLRLRFRDGLDRESFLTAGQVVRAPVTLWPTSVILNKGHRIRIHIASSSYPSLDPNLQNGKPPRTGAPQTATLTLLTGPDASVLNLPTLP